MVSGIITESKNGCQVVVVVVVVVLLVVVLVVLVVVVVAGAMTPYIARPA